MNKYNIGDIVTGKVTGIESYGIFLSLDENVSGLIHISEVSNAFVRNINDYAEMDEIIKAKIIDIDEDGKHLKLSIKNLEYRDSSKYVSKIKETRAGFSGLAQSLDGWIEEKLKQMDKKN